MLAQADNKPTLIPACRMPQGAEGSEQKQKRNVSHLDVEGRQAQHAELPIQVADICSASKQTQTVEWILPQMTTQRTMMLSPEARRRAASAVTCIDGRACREHSRIKLSGQYHFTAGCPGTESQAGGF